MILFVKFKFIALSISLGTSASNRSVFLNHF